jgi:hypothetical protein
MRQQYLLCIGGLGNDWESDGHFVLFCGKRKKWQELLLFRRPLSPTSDNKRPPIQRLRLFTVGRSTSTRAEVERSEPKTDGTKLTVFWNQQNCG